jgi:group II intron reverse transcriptase/maturase
MQIQVVESTHLNQLIMSTKINYEKIISISQLITALERTKNNSSPGLDGETKKRFTEEKIKVLHKELKSQKYQPKPVKMLQIPKPKGAGVRFLGIASQRDKVVQAAILIELEHTLEKVFSDLSFGYRKGRNCHDALHRVKYNWQNTTWLISIDIQKYFDTINHEILIKELYKYCDQATVELVIKMLKCGYVNLVTNFKIDRLEEGTVQGSLISPILSNLYLHALDAFVEQHLLKAWNLGEERRFVKGYAMKKYLSAKDKLLTLEYPELRNALLKVKHNRWVLEGNPSRDPCDEKFRRLYYARYADDFLLGFCGTKAEAEDIKVKLVNFLEDKLKLAINLEKSGIFHSSDKNIMFLGCYIRYQPNKIVVDESQSIDYGITQLKSVAINNASLKAPIVHLLEKAVEKKYAIKKENGNFRATSRRALSGLPEKIIVNRYSSIIRGILQYYSFVNQRSDLWPIVSLYRKSCALTLADKLKLRTAAQTFKKFGPLLSVKDITGKVITKLYYPESLKTKINFQRGRVTLVEVSSIYENEIYGSYNQQTSGVKEKCEIEDCESSENLELHHINPQKNISNKFSAFEKSLIAGRRKTITLCREHHKILHGKKLI